MHLFSWWSRRGLFHTKSLSKVMNHKSNSFMTSQRLFQSNSGFSNPRRFWVAAPIVITPLALYLSQEYKKLNKSVSSSSLTTTSGEDDRESSALLKDSHENLITSKLASKNQFPLEPFHILVRLLFLGALYTPLIILLPIWILYEKWTLMKPSWLRKTWIAFLTWTMEVSGPTFIKLGQWASSRVDLFPPEVCKILSRLQSSVTPHSRENTHKIMEKEFGSDWRHLFESFEEDVKGVGAIAQVYKGILKENKIPVAIKVLHPRVASKIYADLHIMNFFASLISALPGMKWLSLPEEVETFGKMMREQLDLRNEIRNIQLFKKKFPDIQDRIQFPNIFPNLSRETVLIEEYIDGISMNDFLNAGPTVFDIELASLGLKGFLKMLIVDNFVHADLHPGNIIVKFSTPTQTSKQIFEHLCHSTHDKSGWAKKILKLKYEGSKPQLVFIDAGLVTSLSHQNLINFLDLFVAITEFDGRKIAKLMVERSVTPNTVIKQDQFEDKMDNFLKSVKAKTASLEHIDVGEILSTVLNMVRDFHVKIEGEFANVAVAIMLIEGMGKRLDPNIDVIQEAVPILRSVVGRGDQVAEIAQHVYRKAQIYSTVMSVRDGLSRWIGLD